VWCYGRIRWAPDRGVSGATAWCRSRAVAVGALRRRGHASVTLLLTALDAEGFRIIRRHCCGYAAAGASDMYKSGAQLNDLRELIDAFWSSSGNVRQVGDVRKNRCRGCGGAASRRQSPRGSSTRHTSILGAGIGANVL
jgi:hypothetical protein